MRHLHKLFLMILLLLAPLARADLVVVASPKSGVDRLSRQEVVYLFMGRLRVLPSGVPAVPVDAAVDSAERADFYRHLVSKEPAEIKAYWARLIFSGGSRPPLVVDNREELLRLMGSEAGTIGYMERSKLDARFKVVYEFPASP